ncbi:hypothetical protein ZWY2020_020226, partial [Hordeum vulgare]
GAHNFDGRRLWWGVPGCTLHAVLEHIEGGSRPWRQPGDVGASAYPHGYTDVCGQVCDHVVHDVCDPSLPHHSKHIPSSCEPSPHSCYHHLSACFSL